MKSPDTILEVESLSKKFCRNLRRSMFYGAADLLKDVVGLQGDRLRLRPDEFLALDHVSFSLKRGETLGILGRNGSGKSTILRLIAGIYPPDSGEIRMRGTVGALIALGAGFHPHMSGRENIYLNGAIMGLSRKLINEKLDEIIEFSELGPFIEAPVSTYSSGMTVRLGFAIAIFANPSLLIVDEVLAVGDLAFSLKCYRQMEKYRSAGGSILLVSHSNQLIRNTCNTAIWLESGKLLQAGAAHEVCDAYEGAVLKADSSAARGTILNYDPSAAVTKIESVGLNGLPKSEFQVGEALTIRVHLRTSRALMEPLLSLTFEDAEARAVAANFAHLDGQSIGALPVGDHIIEYRIEKNGLKRGKYWLTVTFAESRINNVLSWYDKSADLTVIGGDYSFGLYNPFPTWSLVRDSSG